MTNPEVDTSKLKKFFNLLTGLVVSIAFESPFDQLLLVPQIVELMGLDAANPLSKIRTRTRSPSDMTLLNDPDNNIIIGTYVI